jgi:competence protein ComEA
MLDISRSQVVVYGAVAAALLLVGVRAIRAEGGGGGPAEAVASPPSGGFTVASGGGDIVVDVAGAGAAARGVSVAGGIPGGGRDRSRGRPARRGDCGGEHRAARLSDGQQVVVPSRESGGTPVGATGAAAEEGPLSLGSATVDQLDTIDGIGPVTAQKIVEYRESHGGLSSVEQLDQVSGIGPATMESLRARLQP